MVGNKLTSYATVDVEALLERVLAMRQAVLTALQKHQEAAVAAQAQMAQSTGAEPGAFASSSQQPQGSQAEMAVDGETFECGADKGAMMVKGTSSGMDMQKFLRSKRRWGDAEEEEGRGPDVLTPSKCV